MDTPQAVARLIGAHSGKIVDPPFVTGPVIGKLSPLRSLRAELHQPGCRVHDSVDIEVGVGPGETETGGIQRKQFQARWLQAPAPGSGIGELGVDGRCLLQADQGQVCSLPAQIDRLPGLAAGNAQGHQAGLPSITGFSTHQFEPQAGQVTKGIQDIDDQQAGKPETDDIDQGVLEVDRRDQGDQYNTQQPDARQGWNDIDIAQVKIDRTDAFGWRTPREKIGDKTGCHAGLNEGNNLSDARSGGNTSLDNS